MGRRPVGYRDFPDETTVDVKCRTCGKTFPYVPRVKVRLDKATPNICERCWDNRRNASVIKCRKGVRPHTAKIVAFARDERKAEDATIEYIKERRWTKSFFETSKLINEWGRE